MPPRAVPERTRDRDRTRAEILAVATEEFSEHGYSGARVDEIAERTRTTKRMLYYYFESKEGLYAEVLKTAYAEIRAKEQAIDVEHLDPVAAIRRDRRADVRPSRGAPGLHPPRRDREHPPRRAPRRSCPTWPSSAPPRSR